MVAADEAYTEGHLDGRREERARLIRDGIIDTRQVQAREITDFDYRTFALEKAVQVAGFQQSADQVVGAAEAFYDFLSGSPKNTPQKATE